MNEIEITTDQVLETMQTVVDEYGRDYIYQPPAGRGKECVYEHNGECSCLIGITLHRLGVSIETLNRFDHAARFDGSMSIYSLYDEGVLNREGVSMDMVTTLILQGAQRVQDLVQFYSSDDDDANLHLSSWGRALDEAFDIARTYGRTV